MMHRGFEFCLAVALARLVLAGVSATAQVVGGGGPSASDCWVTFDSVPSPNQPASNPSGVRCADQDGSCGDANPALGYCTFGVQMAFNSTTGFSGCFPTAVPAGAFAIPYSGPANDDHPKHVPDFEPLVQFAGDQLPLTTTDTNQVSGYVPVTVPLEIVFRSAGPRFRDTSVTLQTALCTTALLMDGACPTGVPVDSDRFKMTCTAPVDGSGAKISPCAGIAGTFQQIQEHIFDRKCTSLATCHGSADPAHDLCLKPSCGARSAYIDLVDVPPLNLAAALDGVKRVDPSNPENSLLYRKIRGGTALRSPSFGSGAYGMRMPYHNPAAGRSRPKLSSGEIRLITDWIRAGAPETGFVASRGACSP